MSQRAEDIARQVLRAFFGDEEGFKDMSRSPERRACVATVEKALLSMGEWDDVLSQHETQVMERHEEGIRPGHIGRYHIDSAFKGHDILE